MSDRALDEPVEPNRGDAVANCPVQVPAGGLHVEMHHVYGMSVVTARGRLVRHLAGRLSVAIDAAAAEDGMIVVDNGGVSLLDTIALGICMTSAHAARSHGRAVVVLPPAGHAGHDQSACAA